MTTRCDHCRWWVMDGFEVGFCQRHAPVVDPQAIKGYNGDGYIRGPQTLWPKTRSNDFCGDYELEPSLQQSAPAKETPSETLP